MPASLAQSDGTDQATFSHIRISIVRYDSAILFALESLEWYSGEWQGQREENSPNSASVAFAKSFKRADSEWGTVHY